MVTQTELRRQAWESGKLHSYYTDAIPARLIESLERYIVERCPVGDFLRAVLSNDLRDAIGRADPTSLAAMQQLVALLHNEAPSACWGSPAKVAAWLGQEVRRG